MRFTVEIVLDILILEEASKEIRKIERHNVLETDVNNRKEIYRKVRVSDFR